MTDKIAAFPRPLRATDSCRHYSYLRSANWKERGPRCALGIDLSKPGASPCFAEPKAVCPSRADYTEVERLAWRAHRDASLARLAVAVAALPAPLPINSSGEIECPNCAGTLTFSRWKRGAELSCTTPNCCGAHFNIDAGADWPQAGKD